MNCILVSLKFGSSSLGEKPYVVFLDGDLSRSDYLEARASHERPGYLITGETAVALPDGSVDLNTPYAE